MTEKLEPQEILALPLGGPGFLTSKTVGQYLMSTLRKFVNLQEGFDSKRPFGSGDWEDPLILAFANAGLIWLRTDENSQIEDYPTSKFWDIVNDLTDFLMDVDYTTMDRILPPPPPKEWYVVSVDQDTARKGEMNDFFKQPFTELEARTKAAEQNEVYDYRVWVPVHIPT